MRILIVGSGAREHALGARIARDCATEDEIVFAPGNAGTRALGPSIEVDAGDVGALTDAATRARVDLVVSGPEAPLVGGLADALAARGILAFGPSKAAAQLEGSKVFAKHFMKRHGVPTAAFETFSDPEAAEAYVRDAKHPLVVKADGLAQGKGVIVPDSPDEAIEAIRRIMRDRAFGAAGAQIVLEEKLAGAEVSYHVVTDGESYVALEPCEDHKRLRDGDRGPNTGGMGAYGPTPIVTAEMEREILETIVDPTLRGMRDDGAPFRGALFVGLMIDAGKLRVLEYNVRFGDPETEVLMPLRDAPLLPLLAGAARGDLGATDSPRERAPSGAAVAVVLAAEGYPDKPVLGREIAGLDEAAAVPEVSVFHGATALRDGRVVTNGGRVLTIAARGASVDEAAERAYRAAACIRFEGMQMRTDIAHRARSRAR